MKGILNDFLDTFFSLYFRFNTIDERKKGIEIVLRTQGLTYSNIVNYLIRTETK